MSRYIALLRGINISGKNKIPMAELKKGLEQLGFGEVKTYLNSGNVAFSSGEAQADGLTHGIEAMIHNRFGLEIPVFVLPQQELAEILSRAPDWWGTEDKEIYDNLIFILPPASFADVWAEIGPPKEGLERIESCRGAIFWSFRRSEYQKTNWWPRTASAAIGRKLTIRTAGTVQKIAGM